VGFFITDTYDEYKSVVGERGLKFSAGESQRIALARAFLADPAILILDEPTSALDAKNEKLITNVLEDLWQNRTTFIIAHRLSTVHNADTILVLKDGRIAEAGSHDKLIDQGGEYKRLHDLQIGLHQ
jgi:subfamily B ATP-binding cassette protein MsbA